MPQPHQKNTDSDMAKIIAYGFSIGMDTMEMAKRLRLDEAAVYNALARVREEMRDG